MTGVQTCALPISFLVDVFRNQSVALPEKLGGFAVHFFGDASAQDVVAVINIVATAMISKNLIVVKEQNASCGLQKLCLVLRLY